MRIYVIYTPPHEAIPILSFPWANKRPTQLFESRVGFGSVYQHAGCDQVLSYVTSASLNGKDMIYRRGQLPVGDMAFGRIPVRVVWKLVREQCREQPKRAMENEALA